jgi:hypothetical protein
MRRRILLPLFAAVLVVVLGRVAAADKIDDLTKSLLQDSSYKVRVQAALVLGKLKDRRAVPALKQALRDENATVRGTAAASLGLIGDPSARDALEGAAQDVDGFVKGQAQKALAALGAGGPKPSSGGGRGAKFYLAIGFSSGGKAGPEAAQMVRDALARELQKLPQVTLSIGAGEPSASALQQRKLQGFMVDGTIQRLSAVMSGGGAQIDCDLKAFVATYPGKSIKMMTTEGASLQAGASERESAKRDCINAAAEAIRDDVEKYLKTVE